MIQKYAAALISISIVLVTAVTQLPDGRVSPATLVQFAIIAVQAFATYLLPLTDGRWQASLKVSVNVALAILAALSPIVLTGQITAMQWAVVILAALNALGAEIGVRVRTDHALAA